MPKMPKMPRAGTLAILLAVFCCPPAWGQAHPGQFHPGLKNITTRAYSPSLMDPVIFANLWQSWDAASREAAGKMSKKARREMTLERYGLLEAPYDNGGAPLGMVVKQDGSYALNCLACHAGAVAGQTIIGLPNNALDFSAIYEDVGKTVAILHADRPGDPPFPEGLVTMSSGDDPSTVHFPEGLLSVSKGGFNSFTFSVYFLSHRDRDLNVLETPLQLNPLNHYLDPPPLWYAAKKKAFYSDAWTEKSVRSLMQFSLDPSVDPVTFKSWEDDYKEIYEWLHTLESPKYEGAIDDRLAAAGKQIYADSCIHCHGAPGPGGEYENEVTEIKYTQTDRTRLDGLSSRFKEHFGKSWMGRYGETEVVLRPEGYVAPPHDGVWATAPYFHNGSVPTLYHVLFPEERPRVWKVKDYRSYDHQRGGLLVEEFQQMPETATLAEKRAYCDTRQESMSNLGHPFADHLSKEQRLSLLEYLKTL